MVAFGELGMQMHEVISVGVIGSMLLYRPCLSAVLGFVAVMVSFLLSQ